MNSASKFGFPEYVFIGNAELREFFYRKNGLPQVTLYYVSIHTYSIQVMNSVKAHSLHR